MIICIYFFKGKFNVPSWAPDGDPRLKITQIEFLDEVRDKFAKNINISIQIEALNTTLLDDLETIFSDHPGETKINIQFEVLHAGKPVKINGAVRQFSVDPNNEFMLAISSLPMIEYKLSAKGW